MNENRMKQLAGIPLNEAKKPKVKEILYHYVEGALQLSHDDNEDNLSDSYIYDDVDKSTIKDIEKRIKKFVKDAGSMLDGISDENIGYNLVLSGTGATDAWNEERRWGGSGYEPTDDSHDLDDLTDKHFSRGLMDSFYVGDDGKVY